MSVFICTRSCPHCKTTASEVVSDTSAGFSTEVTKFMAIWARSI